MVAARARNAIFSPVRDTNGPAARVPAWARATIAGTAGGAAWRLGITWMLPHPDL